MGVAEAPADPEAMTAAVQSLGVTPIQEQRRNACVEALEKMLTEAREGQGFESVFILATYPDNGKVRQLWPAGTSTLKVVGALEHLKHELLADMREFGEG
jgi:Na+-translocating ferredoxin:NAD+ oxidoreductase RnfG subunit